MTTYRTGDNSSNSPVSNWSSNSLHNTLKCLNDKEGLSNNIQRAALLETSHTVCEFLSPQAELTFIISLVKAVITIMVNQCNTETEHIQGASKKFGEWMDISKAT